MNSPENTPDITPETIDDVTEGKGLSWLLSKAEYFFTNLEEKGLIESLRSLFAEKKEERSDLMTEIEEDNDVSDESFSSKLHRFFDNVKSMPAEKNPETNVTLCSKTARSNLENFLGKDVLIGDGPSAQAAYEKIGSPKNDINELIGKPGVNVVDIYLDASSKNADFGHRAVAVRTHNGFKVLDPYYTIGNGVEGVSLDVYLEHMEKVKGRRIWGGKAYA